MYQTYFIFAVTSSPHHGFQIPKSESRNFLIGPKTVLKQKKHNNKTALDQLEKSEFVVGN